MMLSRPHSLDLTRSFLIGVQFFGKYGPDSLIAMIGPICTWHAIKIIIIMIEEISLLHVYTRTIY